MHERLERKYTAAWYDYREREMRLSYWSDGHRNRKVERLPFKWYFYLSSKQFEDIDCPVFRMMVDGVKRFGDWVKVFSSPIWRDRRELFTWLQLRNVEPYEMDLSPVNRFLTDRDIEFDRKLRILYFDLETDGRPGWDRIPEHRILSVAWSESGKETKCMLAKSNDDAGEAELLGCFLREVVSRNDVLVAWNGKRYDEVVLKERCRHHAVRLGEPNWRMVNFLDMMLVFQHPYYGYGRDAEGKGVRVSYSLNNIANAVLGWGKLETPGSAEEIVGMWQADKERFARYNMRDVDVMVALENERHYIEGLRVLSHICGRFLSDWSVHIGYLNDAFVLRWGAGKGLRFPTKLHAFQDDGWKRVQIKGAFVMEPKVGMFDGVANVDFSALYANIIETFNISPEVLVGNEDGDFAVACNGARFKKDVDGVFPQIVRVAKRMREPHKTRILELERKGKEDSVVYRVEKQLSDAWKLLGNGSYGALGSPWLRYYSPICAEAVTSTGRAIIEMALDEAGKMGLKPLAADTDGMFLHCGEGKAKKFCSRMVELVDEWVDAKGGRPGFIRLELAPIYRRIFFTTKKRYAGVKETGKVEVKGLELARSDGCRYAREMQRAILNYVLETKIPDHGIAAALVIEWRDRLILGDVPVEDLVIAQSVNKALDDYKVECVHVKIARKMLDDGLEVYEGMKIPYVVVGKEKDGRLRAVHLDDYDGNYNAKEYWKKVYPPSQRILEAVFPVVEWEKYVRIDTNQGSLL